MERDYKELKGCEICRKPFTLTRIRHKCKRCKLIICSDCGKAKSIIIGYNKAPSTPHRICIYCRDDVTAQQDYKNRYGTSWAHLSQLGREWLTACSPQALSFHNSSNYQKYLEESEINTGLAPILTDLLDEISQGRADRESYNYSLVEFFYYSQQGKERNAIRRNVENVLRAFYACYPEQGYVNVLVNIVTFLLCFLDEEGAFHMLCFLNERIVPERFWDSHSTPIPFIGLQKEKYIIKHGVRNILGNVSQSINLKPFEIVYKKLANVMIGSLLIDTVNFNTQVYVWNEVFSQRSFKAFENSVIKVLKISKRYFDEFSEMNLYNYRIFSCRNIQASYLRSDPLIFPDEDRKVLSETFDNSIIELIVANNKVMSNSLQRLQRLNSNEVGLILSRIRFMIQATRGVDKKQDRNYVDLDTNAFLSLFREIESFRDLQESDLMDVFNVFDINKTGVVSSRIVAGLIILLISEDLNSKLNDIFSLFDLDNDKQLSVKEIPPVIGFLSEILPVLNEANPTYLNFQVHLYEMLETLRKKVKKLEKVTAQDFQSIVSKYPVFQVVTGEKRTFRRGASLINDYIDETQDDTSPSMDNGNGENQSFAGFAEQRLIPVENEEKELEPAEIQFIKREEDTLKFLEKANDLQHEIRHDLKEVGYKKELERVAIEEGTKLGTQAVNNFMHTSVEKSHNSFGFNLKNPINEEENRLKNLIVADITKEVDQQVDKEINKELNKVFDKELVKEIDNEINKDINKEILQIAETTKDSTEVDIENSDFLNNTAIKAQITPAPGLPKGQNRNAQVDKENSCSVCNMF